MTDWYKSCSYDAGQKRRFHAAARSQLRVLATALCLLPGSFEIRSSQGGPTVSGEITLHHQDIYVQVAQSMIAGDKGILALVVVVGISRAGRTSSRRSLCSTISRHWPSGFGSSGLLAHVALRTEQIPPTPEAERGREGVIRPG